MNCKKIYEARADNITSRKPTYPTARGGVNKTFQNILEISAEMEIKLEGFFRFAIGILSDIIILYLLVSALVMMLV